MLNAENKDKIKFPLIENYNEEEYFYMITKYDLLPQKKKDFKELLGVRIKRRDFEIFRKNWQSSAELMAFFLNYF